MATILIIEANPSLRAAMSTILELAGYQTLATDDGPSGIALALEHSPAIVLCDAARPHPNGLAVLAALRQNPSTASIPFFLMATHLSEVDTKIGVANGVSGFLIKPFTERELLRKLETRMDQ